MSYDKDLFMNENASIFPIIAIKELRPYFNHGQEAEPENANHCLQWFSYGKFQQRLFATILKLRKVYREKRKLRQRQ
ncbi:hypothetical protein HZP98_04425 [Elizabethkingia anophelis]|nr:hypothetical protein [Elizabethkingia anophelis]MCT3951268.1 hypothetical protein [Elizabethkingia anophelis]MCT3954811.1 hypothetical protein [Elizabethkingia anophelis]MCT3986763.1 hypothetical protein [Elizabethkingia anophelis]MCT4064946.1 hypothetical protein [Elizabethkingia anophelis]